MGGGEGVVEGEEVSEVGSVAVGEVANTAGEVVAAGVVSAVAGEKTGARSGVGSAATEICGAVGCRGLTAVQLSTAAEVAAGIRIEGIL
jgi:hypothetical protein